jgi:hypothetical protein
MQFYVFSQKNIIKTYLIYQISLVKNKMKMSQKLRISFV